MRDGDGVAETGPTGEQKAMLEATMRACNVAANRVAEVAFAQRTAKKIALQKMVYADLRAGFGLSSQMAVRAVAKAGEAYTRDTTIKPVFRADGAVRYHLRILTWKDRVVVSILTLASWSSTRAGGRRSRTRSCAGRSI